MSCQERGLPVLFASVAELAGKLGVKRVNELPGCWEHDLGHGWKFALNGHRRDTQSSIGKVPPFHVLFTHEGWPALLVSPSGGMWIGEDREDELIGILQRAVRS